MAPKAQSCQRKKTGLCVSGTRTGICKNKKRLSVVYFNQRTCACICMVEINWKHFLLIFKCFWSFLTMRTRAQACVCWSKYNRRTDRQTNSLTPYTGVCRFFLSVKFANSLLSSLAGDYLNLKDGFKLATNKIKYLLCNLNSFSWRKRWRWDMNTELSGSVGIWIQDPLNTGNIWIPNFLKCGFQMVQCSNGRSMSYVQDQPFQYRTSTCKCYSSLTYNL